MGLELSGGAASQEGGDAKPNRLVEGHRPGIGEIHGDGGGEVAVDAVAGQAHGIVQHEGQHAAVYNAHGLGGPGLGVVLQLHGKGGTVA